MSAIQILFGEEEIELREGEKLSIGRTGHNADLEISDASVSRKHAEIENREGTLCIKDLKSLNGVYLNGNKVETEVWHPIEVGDEVKLVSIKLKVKTAAKPIEVLTKIPEAAPKASKKAPKEKPKNKAENLQERLRTQGKLRIGRKADNDIVLSDPTVGRYHAELSYENDEYWLTDLDSLNGTYVNGERLKGRKQITTSDDIVIALDAINLLEGVVDLRKQKSAISAKSIFKKYPNKKIGLQPLSVEIPYSNFVALMGPSGCGKSTLLKCLNGDNPASDGEVFIHGLSLKKNFNPLKRKIGYVPQDDIIHKELTVQETLYYAAKIRLPDDTSDKEIQERIDKVIFSLNLDQDSKKDIRTVRVKDLSGGQRKRVSIAVELLVEPTILFLDEPTSPLDPESIDSFLKSLQQLTTQGTTIIMVTHKPEDLHYVDNVIFLMINGYMTYFGKSENLVSHFKVDDIVKVYAKLSNSDLLETHIEEYYIRPKNRKQKPVPNSEVKAEKPDSLGLQFYWLFSRYFRIKLTDKGNLWLLLSQPIIIASLICLIFDGMRLGVLFLMAISAIWFGVSNAAKEIVGELAIYRRERMFNINIHTYILSKWTVLSLIALVQTLIFVTIIYLKFKASPAEGYEDIYLFSYSGSLSFMFFVAFAATLIGLWLSAFFDNTEKVMTVVPIALMPQIMLSGVITKIDHAFVEFLSFLTLGRWGTEGLARIQDNAAETVNGGLESILRPGLQGELTAMRAMDALGFYNGNNLMDGAFDSSQANIIIVALLVIGFYVMIYKSLKKKDSL